MQRSPRPWPRFTWSSSSRIPAPTRAKRSPDARSRTRSAVQFRLGYAPAGRMAQQYLAPGPPMSDAEALGLCMRRREGEGQRSLRTSLDVPHHRLHGPVVASADVRPSRSTRQSRRARMYARRKSRIINSPESALYKRARCCSACTKRASTSAATGGRCCARAFDLVALHQAGFCNAVAPLGTAFTTRRRGFCGAFANA